MTHHIIVSIKSIVSGPPDGLVRHSQEAGEMNIFDRPVLEAALRIREKIGGSITAITMGPEAGKYVLIEAMAMGVDRSVLISDPAFAGSDTLATSTVLAACVNKLPPADLMLFGLRTSDSDTGHVGPQVSVLLGLPLVTGVRSIDFMENGLKVVRVIDGIEESFEVFYPAALTIHPKEFQPRDAGLAGIESAFVDDEIETWDLSMLGLSPTKVGDHGSGTRVREIKTLAREKSCEILNGEMEEQAEELVNRLVASGLIG